MATSTSSGGFPDTSNPSWTSPIPSFSTELNNDLGSSSTASSPAESYATPTAILNSMKDFIGTASPLINSETSSVDNEFTSITTETATTSAIGAISSTTSSMTPTKVSVADLSHSLQHFGIIDYIVFVMMLVVCAVIGFYFGFIEKKKKKNRINEARRGSEALDYLVGGRKMKVFPVSLSLVASFISGISLLGTSTEIYVYGTQYAFILFTLVISGIISWYIFLPVFCNLQLTSTYEYLLMRYDKTIRLLGSVLFTLGTLLWLPIVIYVPALSFSQVTGIDTHIITPVVCVVCIFYTCVGGLKAVVWTDVIQTFIMLGALIFVIVKGTIEVGGIGVVWQRNAATGRLEAPEVTLDPTVRISILSLLLGGTMHNLAITSSNQVMVQRYFALPGLKQARQALLIFSVGVALLVILSSYNGLLIFATYYDCDPLTTKLATASDQLVPLLVLDVLGFIPGLPGLFVAGVFSAAFSSLSSGLNSLAAVVLEDFIKPFRKDPLTEAQTGLVMRCVVILVGILSVSLVYVVEHMGNVINIIITFGSIANGPLLSILLMGFLMPWINGKSALIGCITSFCVTTFIVVKGQLALGLGEFSYATKPVSTEGCDYSFDILNTTSSIPSQDGSTSFWDYIFHVSFYFYVFIGAFVTIVAANLASLFVGYNDLNKIDPALLAPITRHILKRHNYTEVAVSERKHSVLADTENEMKVL